MLMKNRIITLFCALLSIGTVFSQSQEDFDALLETAGEEKYNTLLEKDPERLAKSAFENRNGYYISEAPGEKSIEITGNALEVENIYPNQPPLTESVILNGELNLIAYDFERTDSHYKYYSVGNSDKILVVLPKRLVEMKFNGEKSPAK